MAAFLIHESVRVGPIIATFLTLHDFNLDHTWPVKWSSVIILGLTLSRRSATGANNLAVISTKKPKAGFIRYLLAKDNLLTTGF